MTYDLILKLKDAGFPMKLSCNEHSKNASHICQPHGLLCTHSYTEPTLSKLIEECGEDFVALNRLAHVPLDKPRWASVGKETKSKTFTFYGSIPKEAVSNLWLALNVKTS